MRTTTIEAAFCLLFFLVDGIPRLGIYIHVPNIVSVSFVCKYFADKTYDRPSALTPLEPQSRFGDKLLKISVVSSENGTLRF